LHAKKKKEKEYKEERKRIPQWMGRDEEDPYLWVFVGICGYL
jgi:hypothetical protein